MTGVRFCDIRPISNLIALRTQTERFERRYMNVRESSMRSLPCRDRSSTRSRDKTSLAGPNDYNIVLGDTASPSTNTQCYVNTFNKYFKYKIHQYTLLGIHYVYGLLFWLIRTRTFRKVQHTRQHIPGRDSSFNSSFLYKSLLNLTVTKL